MSSVTPAGIADINSVFKGVLPTESKTHFFLGVISRLFETHSGILVENKLYIIIAPAAVNHAEVTGHKLSTSHNYAEK